MLKGYIQADYSVENWKSLLDIKAAADSDIDSAASVEAVMAVLNGAQAAMAAVHTLLADAKAAAHGSLNAALAGYAQGDYSPENWAALLAAMATGDTESAASVEDVAAALNTAQEAMAAVHTLLADGRIAVHAGLEAAFAAYSEADYSSDEWMALNAIKTAGDGATDEAADLDGVEAAQSAALAEMAAVQTIAQALAAAKSSAHETLAAALESYKESDYTGEAWTALTGFKTAGDTAIDEAVDLDGVEAAQAAAVAEMAGVQTIAQTLAAAKSTAHDALAAALTQYSESDYTGEEWTALTGFKTAGDTAIDEAADLDGAEAAQAAAVLEMAAVQTIAQVLAAAKSTAHDALAAALGICACSETIEATEVEETTETEEATETAEVTETEENTEAEETIETVEAVEEAVAELIEVCDAEIVVAVTEQTEEPVAEDGPTEAASVEAAEETIADEAMADSQEAAEVCEGIPDEVQEEVAASDLVVESSAELAE
jgi:hypothetical protein